MIRSRNAIVKEIENLQAENTEIRQKDKRSYQDNERLGRNNERIDELQQLLNHSHDKPEA